MIYCQYPNKFTTKFHAFMTHNWSNGNHERVTKVYEALKLRGFSLWFDEEEIKDQIRQQMSNGIQSSITLIVFLTEEYEMKINSGTMSDNCYFEFNLASNMDTIVDYRIPVAMELSMLNPRNWIQGGRLQAELGSLKIMDMTNDDPIIFENQIDKLATRINDLLTRYSNNTNFNISSKRPGSPLTSNRLFLPRANSAPPTVFQSSPPSNTISLLLLTFDEVIELLIHEGCPNTLRNRLDSMKNEINGIFLYHIENANELQKYFELNDLYLPKIRSIYSKIEFYKRNEISLDLVNQWRTKIQSSQDLISFQCQRTFKGHSKYVWSIQQLNSSHLLSLSADGCMKIWNIFTGECENTWKIDSSYPLPMTLLQKNTRLLCASSSANGPLLRIWNLFTGECERIFHQHAWIFMKLTATGDDDENDDRLAMVFEDMSIHIFNCITSTSMIIDEHVTVDDQDGDNDEIVLNRNGYDVLLLFQLQDGRLVSAHNDNAIRIWNLQTKKYDQILHGHEDAPTVMIQLTSTSPHPYPRHRCLVTGSKDKTVKIWNIDTGCCEWTLKGHTNGIHSLIEFSSSGNNHHRLLSGDWDMSVKIWNLLTGECERTFDRCINYIANLLKIDERRFACGGSSSSSSSDGDDSNCIKIWNIETGKCDGLLSGHSQSIKNLLRLKDGRLVSSSADTMIKIWS